MTANVRPTLYNVTASVDFPRVNVLRGTAALTTCTPRQVAQAVVETMETLAKRGVKLVNDVPESFPVIEADSRRVFQILVNLVSNSLRFTTKGLVSLSARPGPRSVGSSP